MKHDNECEMYSEACGCESRATLAARLAEVERRLMEQLSIQELNGLRELVIHCWVHREYINCGYAKMTAEQRLLFDKVVWGQRVYMGEK